MVTRDHFQRLTPGERRRVIALVRLGHGRTRNLTESERDELWTLVAKAEPRRFAGATVDALSPFPIPRRVLYGRQRRPSER
jgi:hypothetical protein